MTIFCSVVQTLIKDYGHKRLQELGEHRRKRERLLKSQTSVEKGAAMRQMVTASTGLLKGMMELSLGAAGALASSRSAAGVGQTPALTAGPGSDVVGSCGGGGVTGNGKSSGEALPNGGWRAVGGGGGATTTVESDQVASGTISTARTDADTAPPSSLAAASLISLSAVRGSQADLRRKSGAGGGGGINAIGRSLWKFRGQKLKDSVAAGDRIDVDGRQQQKQLQQPNQLQPPKQLQRDASSANRPKEAMYCLKVAGDAAAPQEPRLKRPNDDVGSAVRPSSTSTDNQSDRDPPLPKAKGGGGGVEGILRRFYSRHDETNRSGSVGGGLTDSARCPSSVDHRAVPPLPPKVRASTRSQHASPLRTGPLDAGNGLGSVYLLGGTRRDKLRLTASASQLLTIENAPSSDVDGGWTPSISVGSDAIHRPQSSSTVDLNRAKLNDDVSAAFVDGVTGHVTEAEDEIVRCDEIATVVANILNSELVNKTGFVLTF